MVHRNAGRGRAVQPGGDVIDFGAQLDTRDILKSGNPPSFAGLDDDFFELLDIREAPQYVHGVLEALSGGSRRLTDLTRSHLNILFTNSLNDLCRGQAPRLELFRIQPDEGMTVRFAAKVPGTRREIRNVNMDFQYGESFTQSSPEAYERLILDVLLGEPPLFPQHTEVELSWKILDPVLAHWAEQGQPEQYSSGGWGPPSAYQMMANDGRSWRRP